MCLSKTAVIILISQKVTYQDSDYDSDVEHGSGYHSDGSGYCSDNTVCVL